MATTIRPNRRPVYHKLPNAVELDRLNDRVIALVGGARKQRSAPEDRSDYQIFRDLKCGKNKAFLTVLRYVFMNLRDGESLDDVLAPLWMIIHTATEYCADDADVAFEAYLRLDNELRAEAARLELEYVLGDHSTPTLTQLSSTLRRHRTLIEKEESVIHRKLYLGDRIAVA